jgi:NADPH-dependent 2,4-dienoyl-CoA reductase/sulfur reductase-like enzyme
VIGIPLECAVNPRLGREKETAEPRINGDGRTVAVIGAGPAGLAAAEVLASRGFKTVVFERSRSAGGQLKLARVPPKKDKINWYIQDMEGAARRKGVKIYFDTEATVAALEAINPYAVIVAAGAKPIIPDIPGVRRENVYSINAILEGEVKLEGKTVAIIGSGLTGLETAEKLAEDGNRRLVVEMLDEIGQGSYFQNLDDLLRRLKVHRPELLPSHKLVEIHEGEIVLENVKSCLRTTRQVDAVVLAVGLKSDDLQVRELKACFPLVLVIGDARQPGRIYNAVRDGFDTAWNL